MRDDELVRGLREEIVRLQAQVAAQAEMNRQLLELAGRLSEITLKQGALCETPFGPQRTSFSRVTHESPAGLHIPS